MTNHIDLYEGQIILVTGGAGDIGSSFSKSLAEVNAEKVIILDDLSASYKWNIPNLPNVLFVEGSITKDIHLERVFHEKPTYIFFLAAFFANQNSVDYPEKDLLISQLGTIKMLEHDVLQGGVIGCVGSGSSMKGCMDKKTVWSDPPITKLRLQNMLTGAHFPIESTQKIVGDLPYTLEDGVRQTLAWMYEQKPIRN